MSDSVAINESVFAPLQFATIVADPPWRYQKQNGMDIRTAEAHYDTLTTDEVGTLGVAKVSLPDAHLYLWVTNAVMLGQRPTIMGRLSPPDIARSWGFEPKSLITWVKTANSTGEPTRGGMGWYFRGATEHVIFAVRGNAPIPSELREPNVIMAPKSKHSSKPAETFFQLVEHVSPGPYIELFARVRQPGWSVWGDEVNSDVRLEFS